MDLKQILLDTSAYSALKRGHQGIAEIVRQAETISMNPVVLGELRAGFAAGSKRQTNEDELLEFIATPRVRIAPVDEETSHYYAVIRHSLRTAGTPIPANDIWIAASAMQHGLAIVTKDTHFNLVKQVIVQMGT